MTDRTPFIFVQFSPDHAPTLYRDGKPVGIVKRFVPYTIPGLEQLGEIEGADHVELHRDPDYGCGGTT